MKVRTDDRYVSPTADEVLPAQINNDWSPIVQKRDLDKVMFPDIKVQVKRLSTD